MLARRAITIRGVVQGVGFRPFAHGLASRLRVAGFVRNQGDAVIIEAEGEPTVLDELVELIFSCPPPLARIDTIDCRERPPRGEATFRIEGSEAAGEDRTSDSIAADVATCDDCLREILTPGDRRHRYPFTNCTHCGPRLTLIEGLPYDRERTTMARFAMCTSCRAEYEDPRNRRFHAQPIACPQCGPILELWGGGRPLLADEALVYAGAQVRAGQIGAVKGLGGYHLVCDAQNADAVRELRRRKGRDAKPFAVMAPDLDAVLRCAVVTETERKLLVSPAHPIVLLDAREGTVAADEIAPGLGALGVMLPYTPLHHLLIREAGGRLLVMTSGNVSDGPIAFDDADARTRLEPLADFILAHDRRIHVACDDSVVKVVAGTPVPFRRSRGYAPLPIVLPTAPLAPTLALGGQMKAAFAMARGDRAVVSHHLGDLDDYETFKRYQESIAHYERLYGIRPAVLVHDLHPDYASVRYAQARARAEGIALLGVQHHHAHVASAMADNGLVDAVIGVAWDGTGYGLDGAMWGGEFLVGNARAFRRAAHLAYVGMPGGAQAVREPWRMAVAHLRAAGLSIDHPSLAEAVGSGSLRAVDQMIERSFQCPRTSSVGRLFDAVAALLGLAVHVSFEGEAAMRLEALAAQSQAEGAFPFDLDTENETTTIDVGPLIAAVAAATRQGADRADVARRFHNTLAAMIRVVCRDLRQDGGPSSIVLSGGVFMNGLLASQVSAELAREGFHVYRHHKVPPNDGGLCLGQLAIAAARGVQPPLVRE